MPVAHDAASSALGNDVSSLSWAHTSAGANRAVVVGASWNTAETVTGVTYDGAALTSIGSKTHTAGTVRMHQWGMVAQSLTVGATITVTWSALVAGDVQGGAESTTTADQTGGATTFKNFASAETTGGASVTVDITSASGELVVDTATRVWDGNLSTVGAGQTERWQQLDSFYGSNDGMGSTEAGAATVTMSWSSASTFNWVIGGCSIKEVAVAAEAAISGHGALLAGTRNRLMQHG